MSEQTKRAAKEAGRHLETAESYIKEAHKQAEKSGDKGLTQKIAKVGGDVNQIHTEITKRVTENGG